MPLTDDEAVDAVLSPRATPKAVPVAPTLSSDDAAVDEVLSAQKTRAQQNNTAATRMSPDQAATVHKLARDAGIAPWAVEGNEAWVLQELTVRRNRELIEKNPIMATAIANNPAFADASFDDMETAEKIAKAWASGGFDAASRVARRIADRQQQILDQQGGTGRISAIPESLWATSVKPSAVSLARGAANLPGTIVGFGGAVMDVISPLGKSELTSMAKQWGDAIDTALPPVKANGVLSEGWFSGLESLGANAPVVIGSLLAAGPVAGPPLALTLMSASSGGHSAREAQRAGADAWKTLGLATTDAVAEYVTEKIGIKYLMDVPGLKNAFLKTAAKFVGAEMAGEQVATVWQDFNNWMLLNPDKTVAEFGDERLRAAAVTAVATVVGGGGQIALMKGLSELADLPQQKAAADAAKLLDTMQQAANSLALKRDPVAFQAFFQEVSKDATVFIDREQLVRVFSEAKLDINEKLPTAAIQLTEATPEGVEIPVAELVANLSGSGIEEQLVQHLRTSPEAQTLAEIQSEDTTKTTEFFQQEAERILAEQAENEAFAMEAKAVTDNLRTQLEQAAAYSPTVNNAFATLAGHAYTVLADRLGMTPQQVFAKYPLAIRGATAPTTAAPVLDQGATLNIGLNIGMTDKLLSQEDVIAAIERTGAKVTKASPITATYQHDGKDVTENTLVVDLDRELTDEEMLQLAEATGQEAIPQRVGRGGKLHGPKAAEWGDFNPEFFKEHDGRAMSEVFGQAPSKKLIDLYFERFGNVIDPDNVKTLLDRYDGANAAEVHEESSALAKAIYAEALRRNAGGRVVFLAGGGGSGKTEALPLVQSIASAALLYDSTLSALDTAVAKIEAALASGAPVSVVYVNREVKSAAEFAFTRKRVVPLPVLANAHVAAADTIRALSERYADNPHVDIHIINNNGAKIDIKRGTLADVPHYSYDSVERSLYALAEKARSDGHIDEAQYAAIVRRGTGQSDQGVQSGQQRQDVSRLGREAATRREAATVAGPVTGVHFSREPRATLVGSAFGTGMKGAERERIAASTDPRIKQRIAFYVNTGSGITPESGVGGAAHTAELTNLYDADADALKIWRNANGDMNAAESAVLDAGFDGYLTREFGNQGTAVLLGARAVSVKHVGGKADVNVPVAPAANIPAMKAAAAALVRNRAYPAGQLKADAWAKVIDPEIAKLIDFTQFDADRGYYKDEIAKQLWQGGPKLGSFNPSTLELNLLADANLTTFLHELGHFFLTVYADVATQENAPQNIKDDVDTLLKWFGITGDEVGESGGETLAQTTPLDPSAITTNPSAARLVALLRKSRDKALRYVVDGDGNFHFWDAYLAVHQQGSMAAGVPYDYTRRGTVYATPDNLASFAWDIGITTTDLRRYMVGDEILFSAAGYGPVTGAEMAAILDKQDDALLSELVYQGNEVPAPGPLPTGRTPLEIWNAMSLDQQRPYHEQFAESFEQYLFSGKSPNIEMQSLFQRFASWLKKVYGSVKAFVATHAGAKLNPEVEAVMERMLATEQEIADANEQRNYDALFKSAVEAGMTDREFADYMALSEEQREDAEAMLRSRSLRDMKWLQARRNKVIAELQADAKEKRAAMRDTVAKEQAATPLRRAMRWLKRGEFTQDDGTEVKALEGHRLQISEVEALFPAGAIEGRPDITKLGYGQYGMLAEVGQSPDVVAEMFGFTSGEALVRELLAAPKFQDEVEAITDQRMLEEYGDLSSQEAVARAADEAIHNAARARMVATELAALARNVGSPAALAKAARTYAQQLIATKTSKTLKPWAFAAAEVRASKAALAALRKGDNETAAREKRTELANHVAVKEAYAAQAEVKKIIDRFKKIAAYSDDSSAIKTRDAELVAAVRAILAEFGIGTRRGKTAREYLTVVAQHNPDLAAVLSDTIDAVAANAKDWRQLKVSEVRELSEEIESIWFLAKRSKQIEIDGKLVPLKEAQDAMYARLEELGIPDRLPGEDSAVTLAEKRGIMFDRFIGALRRVESWVGAKDGALTGPFRTYMWNPVRDAADAYRADKVRYLKAYRDLLNQIAPTLTRRLIEAPEIGYTFGKDESGMGKAELLHAVLHTGNESNKRKLLLGRGWATDTEAGLDTRRWDAFVARMWAEGVLTKADYDFAQGVWNLLEAMKPAAQKAHREVYGKYFAEITAAPFTTPFGDYAGGYVPAIADPMIVRDADINKLREGEEANMAYAFPTTAKGFTKGRVEYNRPLRLNLGSITQHIDKVLLFSHMTRPVNDVRRALTGKQVAQALSRVDPQAVNTVLIPWLNRAAKQVVETQSPGREGLGRFWSVARSRAGMAAMFANVANSVQQLTGLSLAALRVKPTLLADAMAKFVLSPSATAEYVTGKSSFMATRVENEVAAMTTHINDILLDPSVYHKAQEWTMKHSYFMQSAVDNVVGSVVWLAAYNQGIEAGMTEADAIRSGDSAVRETQGSQAPEDVANFETGSAFYRMFVQFAGYFNMNANLLGTEFIKIARDMGLRNGMGRGLYVLVFGFVTPAIVGELVMQVFKGGPDDDDKDGEYLDDWLKLLFGYAPLRYGTAMVPVAGPIINATANTLNNKPYDDRMSTAPAVSMLESAIRAPVSVYKAVAEDGKPGRAVKDVATLISLTVGVPASAVARPINYLADVAADRVEPTSPADMARGIISGTASPASKQ